MLLVIFCLDKPGQHELRLEHYEARKAYQAAAPIKIVMSGPLTTDDDKLMIGSFILVQADSRHPSNNLWRMIHSTRSESGNRLRSAHFASGWDKVRRGGACACTPESALEPHKTWTTPADKPERPVVLPLQLP